VIEGLTVGVAGTTITTVNPPKMALLLFEAPFSDVSAGMVGAVMLTEISTVPPAGVLSHHSRLARPSVPFGEHHLIPRLPAARATAFDSPGFDEGGAGRLRQCYRGW
jgi:hypothetical protein